MKQLFKPKTKANEFYHLKTTSKGVSLYKGRTFIKSKTGVSNSVKTLRLILETVV